MKNLKQLLATTFVIMAFAIAAPALSPAPAHALSLEGGIDASRPTEDKKDSNGNVVVGADGKPVQVAATPGSLILSFKTISNIIIFLVGAVSVIVIIYGGFLYVTSTGDAKRVESAKSTILYAVVGIVVAILAYALVNFVTTSLS